MRYLGATGPLSVYRLGATPCYALGPLAVGGKLTGLFCDEKFPSAREPVVVRLQKQGTRDPRTFTVTATGIAADGVAAVELCNAAGAPVEKAAVAHNLFWLDPVAASRVTSFAALSGRGKVVYRLLVG